MNRERKIVVVAALALAGVAVTVWAAAWPPQPYQALSLTGAWFEDKHAPGKYTLITISPEDPANGRSTAVGTDANADMTFGGFVPGAAAMTPYLGTCIRTGPNTWQFKCVSYVTDGKPNATILAILMAESTATLTSSEAGEIAGTWYIYWPAQDKDFDGLPDAGEKPAFVTAYNDPVKRL